MNNLTELKNGFDKIKERMKGKITACIFGGEDGNFANIDLINIYEDKSGLTGLMSGRCSCCSSSVFDLHERETIEELFSMEDQLELAEHFVMELGRFYQIELGIVPTELKEHMKRLVEYLYEDEKKHKREMEGDGKHMFDSVEALRDWLGLEMNS